MRFPVFSTIVQTATETDISISSAAAQTYTTVYSTVSVATVTSTIAPSTITATETAPVITHTTTQAASTYTATATSDIFETSTGERGFSQIRILSALTKITQQQQQLPLRSRLRTTRQLSLRQL